MGKSSKGPDTSGLEEATRQATALQERIYDETRDDVQPWYQMGTGAVSKLSDLLGISGGSVQSRDDIYNELLPQYTSTETYGSKPKTKRIMTGTDRWNRPVYDDVLISGGEGVTTKNTTNYDALNAAVDERFGAQQETPEGFGSLLERFGMDTFEQDPGYQFRQDESRKALERSMAAQGVTLGGGGFGEINPQAYRALDEQSQGLASQEYGNAYGRYVNDQLNTFNMLMGASGSGQQVTGQMANAGQNYATNVGNLQTGLAQAQYQANQANQGGGSMFGSLLGAGVGAAFGGLPGARLGAGIGGML